MIHQFKKGDKVTVREGATSIQGHKRDPKEVRTVVRVWSNGRVGLHPTGDGTFGNIFEPVDLVPYVEAPAPLDPTLSMSDVEAGKRLAWTNSGIEVRSLGVENGAVVFQWDNGAQGQLPLSEVANYLQPAPEPELPEGTIALIYGQKHVLIKRGRTLIAHAERHSGDPMVEGTGKDAGLNNKMLWVNIERGWAFNEYRSPLQTEASTPQVVYNPDTSVVIDPEEVDVDALGHVIWDASRADEGSISHTGARIVASAIRTHLGIEARP